MRLRTPVLVLAALLALFLPASSAGASPEPPRDTDDDVVDSPVEAAQVLDQHGGMGGHLPASSANVELVGKVRLTNVPGGISDVGAFGNMRTLVPSTPSARGAPGPRGPASTSSTSPTRPTR
jgi:hypothetical protein